MLTPITPKRPKTAKITYFRLTWEFRSWVDVRTP